MSTMDLARESFENIRITAHEVLDDIPTRALTWRIDPEANSIAWLIWHLARVQDNHIAELAGRDQVWSGEWATRFGLAADDQRDGYQDTSEQVAQVAPADVAPLCEYLDEVTDATVGWLGGIDTDGDWDRIVDESYEPAVTAGVRLASVINDDLQHVGQAALLRGIYQRTTP